jgi:DNA-binding NarL/FixJ family response regulator
MSKVLLIEPHKVLRQAISLALFPEHEVQAEENISSPHVASLDNYDLLIIDGVALRESNQLTAEVTRGIQDCKAAVLWLEDDESAQSPDRAKLLKIQKPIEKKTLQSALSHLLPSDKGSRVSTSVVNRPETGKRQDTIDTKRAEASDQAAFQFIELVDAVEEESDPGQGKRSARKSRKSK